MEIEHFSHDHPLILRDETTKNDKKDKCSVCKQPISGRPSYGCRVGECKEEFVIHKSCAELPQQIQHHHFHPLHPLILSPRKAPTEKTTTPDDDDFFSDDDFFNDDDSSSSSSSRCKGCGKYSSGGFVYRCAADCEFDLDVGCASLVPTFSYEGHHDHPLTLFDKFHRNFFVFEDKKCNHCNTQCDKNVFRCVACDFNVHKSCVEFPKQIQQHPSHPLHTLSLSPKPISKSSGSVGETDREKDREKDREMEIEHFSHAHPLILRDETTKKKDEEDKCSVCKQPISGGERPSYGCRREGCNEFMIHKSCAELPQQIQHHHFHPLHPLTLSPPKIIPHDDNDSSSATSSSSSSSSSRCKACKKYSSGFIYRCAECEFDLDIGCASLVPTTTFSYQGHDHPLTFFSKIHRNFFEDIKCNHCDTQCDEDVFRCVACDFSIHKHCAEFPKQIQQHPFHPLHILSLSPKPTSKSSWWQFWTSDYCDACGKSCSGSVYTCEACAFNIHLECSTLVPNISYEHHDHLLTCFDDKSDSERSCYCCGKDGKTSFCRCVQCDFNVHKSCTELPREIRHPFHRLHPLTLGDCPNQEQCDFCHRLDIHHLALKPNKAFVCGDCNFVLQIPCFVSLPLNIDHKCHVCPMTLADSFVEEDNDDSDEHYCDACETQRDPKRPVYFCTECEFVAHINCVIPTEVLSLPTFKQKIKKTAEEAENKLSSTLNDFTFNRAFERGTFQVGDVANPDIAKLDEDIAKLCADIEAMVEKLKNLKSKRVKLLEQVKAAPKEIS